MYGRRDGFGLLSGNSRGVRTSYPMTAARSISSPNLLGAVQLVDVVLSYRSYMNTVSAAIVATKI